MNERGIIGYYPARPATILDNPVPKSRTIPLTKTYASDGVRENGIPWIIVLLQARTEVRHMSRTVCCGVALN